MSLLTDIKHKFGNWMLKRSNLEEQRVHQVFNLSGARRIAVLFDATEPKNIQMLKSFVNSIAAGKQVSALGYVNKKDKSFEHMSILHFDFFSNEELNWFGKPQGMVIDNFLKEDFDILIDLTLTKFYPLTYLAVASPSKFKVGRTRSDVDVFDLTIDPTKDQDLAVLIEQITHYLNRIKPL